MHAYYVDACIHTHTCILSMCTYKACGRMFYTVLHLNEELGKIHQEVLQDPRGWQHAQQRDHLELRHKSV